MLIFRSECCNLGIIGGRLGSLINSLHVVQYSTFVESFFLLVMYTHSKYIGIIHLIFKINCCTVFIIFFSLQPSGSANTCRYCTYNRPSIYVWQEL